MTNKLKWSLLALLGFSAACATVKHTANGTDASEADPGQENTIPEVEALYGVRVPVRVADVPAGETPEQPQPAEAADSLSSRSDAAIPAIRLLYGVPVPVEGDTTRSVRVVPLPAQPQPETPESPEADQ